MCRNSFGPCIKNILHLCILPFVTSILLAEDVYGKFMSFTYYIFVLLLATRSLLAKFRLDNFQPYVIYHIQTQ